MDYRTIHLKYFNVHSFLHLLQSPAARDMPKRCERREMPRSPHEKRVRATIMEDKACYEYHVLSHEAICIFVTPAPPPMRTCGQTTHYADNASMNENHAVSPSAPLFSLPLPSPTVPTVPTFLTRKKGTVKYILHMRWAY